MLTGIGACWADTASAELLELQQAVYIALAHQARLDMAAMLAVLQGQATHEVLLSLPG